MKAKYTHKDKQAIFETIIHRNYVVDGNKKAIDALHEYMLGGDVDAFIQNGGDTVDAFTVFYFGGEFSIEKAKKRLAAFIKDCRLSPEKYSNTPHINRSDPNWEEILIQKMVYQLFSFCGAFLSPSNFRDVFYWFFGETYNVKQELVLDVDGDTLVYVLDTKSNWVATTLLRETSEYLFPMDDDVYFDLSRMKGLCQYLYSVMPYVSVESFSKQLYPRRHELPNGQQSSYRVLQFGLRRMIALLNGVVSKSEKERGFDRLIISDEKELAEFREQFDAIQWPQEYYDLVEFIIESGPDYVKASVDEPAA